MFSFLFWVLFLGVWTKTAGNVCGGVKSEKVAAKGERVQAEGGQREKSMHNTGNCCMCLVAALIINVLPLQHLSSLSPTRFHHQNVTFIFLDWFNSSPTFSLSKTIESFLKKLESQIMCQRHWRLCRCVDIISCDIRTDHKKQITYSILLDQYI